MTMVNVTHRRCTEVCLVFRRRGVFVSGGGGGGVVLLVVPVAFFVGGGGVGGVGVGSGGDGGCWFSCSRLRFRPVASSVLSVYQCWC